MSTPPPIPPQNNRPDEAPELPGRTSGNPNNTEYVPEVEGSEPPQLPPHPEDVEEINVQNSTENVYNAPQPGSKKNLLWIIPSVLLLLAVAGGIYFYFSAKKEQEQERQEVEDARQEEQERLQAIQDSIDAARREQATQDSLMHNASSADLAMFGLHGPVKSVMFKLNYIGDGYESDGFNSFFSDISIEYDRGGNIVSWGSLNEGRTPAMTRNSAGAITSMDLPALEMTVNFQWSGKHLSSVTFNSSATNQLTFGSFDGNSPGTIAEHFSYETSDSQMTSDMNYTLNYSDRDEYGNWLKGDVRGSGNRKNSYMEYDSYYEIYQPRNTTENVTTHYTITRYISYFDKSEYLQ